MSFFEFMDIRLFTFAFIFFGGVSLALYIRSYFEKKESKRIANLDIESRKIEILKLHGNMNKYKTSHVLHLLLTVLCFGLWIIPWFLIAQSNSGKRDQIARIMKDA